MSQRFTLPAASATRGWASTLRFAGLALLGSAILAVSAHVAVPFWPVPVTLQTLAVLLLGVFLGPATAAAAVLAYWAEGFAGLPVFAQGTGMAALLGPTGGYLVGFLPAVALAGLLNGRRKGPVLAVALLLGADAVILALGFGRLATLIGPEKAWAAGVLPFLLGEGVKVALAVAVAELRPTTRRRARRG